MSGLLTWMQAGFFAGGKRRTKARAAGEGRRPSVPLGTWPPPPPHRLKVRLPPAVQQDYFIFWIFHSQESHSFVLACFDDSYGSAFSGLPELGLRNKQQMLLLPKLLLALTLITSFRFMLTELFLLERFFERKKEKKKGCCCVYVL